MTTVYENIYIGQFIYSLGYYVGIQREKINSSQAINLYQQTRSDTVLSDFFCSISGRSLLIEFKKGEEEIKTELKKPLKTELKKPLKKTLLDMISDEPYLRTVSQKAHFIAF